MKETKLEMRQRFVTEQLDWIRSCGGSLLGYIKAYGDPGLAHCYGNGGTAIWYADLEELNKRILKLNETKKRARWTTLK